MILLGKSSLAVLLIGLATAWGQSHAPVTAVERYQIEVSTQKSGDGKVVEARAVYPYAISSLWQVMTNYAEFKQFVPRMRESQVIEQSKRGAKVRFVIEPPFPFPRLWGVLRLEEDEQKHRITWSLLEGNLKRFSGELKLASQVAVSGASTEFIVSSQIVPGNFIPQVVVVWAAKKYLPDTLVRLVSKFRRQEYLDRRQKTRPKSLLGSWPLLRGTFRAVPAPSPVPQAKPQNN